MHTRNTLFISLLLSAPALAQSEANDATPDPTQSESRFSFTIGVDYTSQYFFRGIVQEDNGFIIQPYTELGFSLIDHDDWAVDLFAGTWSSIHSETSTAAANATLSSYYELDLYAGISVGVDAWSFGAQYIAYTSPSSAFSTVHEIDFSIAYDDSESPLLGELSLSPYAAIAIEVGDNAADGGDQGAYLELGIAPSYAFDDQSALKDLTLTFPVTVGLNLGDYYEFNGGDDTFGFVDIGIEASFPIDLGEGTGDIEAYVGVHSLFMSDDLSTVNSNDDTELIITAGVSLSF